MTSMFVAEGNKLSNIYKNLEKTLNTVFEQLIKYGMDFKGNEFSINSEEGRVGDVSQPKIKLEDIFKQMKGIKKSLIDDNAANIIDLRSFKIELVDILKNIQSSKVYSQIRLKELKAAEHSINNEMEVYCGKLPIWCQTVKCEIRDTTKSVRNSTNNVNVPEEVKIFMDFIRDNGGHENGWSSSNHHLFLKLRKKFSTVDTMIYHLHQLLPDLDEDFIRRHEIWYTKYVELKEKQKIAIEKWQNKKQNEKLLSLEVQKNSLENNKTSNDTKASRKILRPRQNNTNKIREIKKKDSILQVRALKDLEMEKEQRRLHEEKKKIVNEWKLHRNKKIEEVMQREKKIEKEQKKIRVAVAKKMIKIYQSQDISYILKRKLPEMEIELKLKTSHTLMDKRDPNRLFKPTEQWTNRLMKNDNIINVKPLSFVQNVQKLHVPNWRKGIV